LNKGQNNMATKPVKKPQTHDLDQSIQIALDAADASMDVTAEFERISQRFNETTGVATRLVKTARLTVGVAAGIAILAILVMGMIWQRSSSGLERLAATNSELLMILTENVVSLEQSMQPLRSTSDRIDEVVAAMTALEAGVTDITLMLGMLEQEMDQFVGSMEEIETATGATERAEQLGAAVTERIATLNGELAMNVSTAVRDALSRQAEDFKRLVNDFSNALDSMEGGVNSSALQEVQAKMEARLNEINNRLGDVQRARSAAVPPRRPAPAAPEPDTIKFP
jgi:type IV secretory pathway VirB2 component (pilin)